MRADIPAILPTVKPKKDLSVFSQLFYAQQTINIYSKQSSKTQRLSFFIFFICSSFYGLSARQSSVLGEDPLFNDHDPVALISAARQGTQGYTRSSTRLAKSLTTISTGSFSFPILSLGADIVGVPFSKRILSPASIGAFIGIIIAILVMFIPLDKENPAVQRCAGVLIIMATLWISEAVPLSVTALLPVVLFPVLDVLKGKEVATQYFNDGTLPSTLSPSYLLILGRFPHVVSYGEMESSYAYCLGNHAVLLGSPSYAFRYYVHCCCIIYFCK